LPAEGQRLDLFIYIFHVSIMTQELDEVVVQLLESPLPPLVLQVRLEIVEKFSHAREDFLHILVFL